MDTVVEDLLKIWDWTLSNLIVINLILSVVIVFFQRRDPKAVWTWLLALYFVPVFGFLFYLLLCQDFHKDKMFRVKEVEDRLNISARSQENYFKHHEMSLEEPMERDYKDLVIYNLETSGAVLTLNNHIRVFTDGKEKFEDLRRELRRAEHFIHIQYYIIKNDEVFNSLIPILLEKVKEGVEVRILYDGMGGRFMPKKKWQEMEAAGVKVGAFFPATLGRINLRVNYRNHRKIVVIDGKIGYVGGFNIGKEYIGKDPKFGYWRDTHLKLYGDAVISLQVRFALDWNYACRENLFKHAQYFDIPRPVENLLRIAALKAEAHRAYVTEVYINRQEVRLTMYPKAKLKVEGIPELVARYRGDLKFQAGEAPVIHFIDQRNKNKDCDAMMERAKELLEALGGLVE